MIHHMVLLRIRSDVPRAEVAEVFRAIDALRGKIPGILSFAWGPYASPEGLQRGFTYAFHMTFRDADARDAYLPHPEHERVKAQVLGVLEGGLDGVLAFDFES
jgi:hypothetical protein